MSWWTGHEVQANGEMIHVKTLYEVLDRVFRPPKRTLDLPLRIPISNIYPGQIVAGRIEQGELQEGQELMFLPQQALEDSATVRSIQIHSKPKDSAQAGDFVGLTFKDLDPGRKVRWGDVVVLKDDPTFQNVLRFHAEVLVRKAEIRIGL